MDDLSWDDLRVFLAAWRAGSLSAAASRLGIRQSTVSRRIQALEQSVGGPVFLRGKTGLMLTSRGTALIEGAVAMEAGALQLSRAAAEAEAEVVGEVRLALAPGLASLWLAPRLPELLDLHPRLQLELVVSTTVADLTRREADLALRFVAPVGDDSVAQRLGALPMALLAHPRWLSTPWDQLRWVLVTVPGLVTAEEDWTRRHGAQAPVVHTTDYIAGLAAVEAGVGVMVASRALVGRGGLVALDGPVPLPAAMPLWLVGHRASRSSPRVDAVWRALVGWAHQDLQEVLGSSGGPA